MRPEGAEPYVSDEADRRFARYRDTGDPEDLAATFERTSAGLLRLARQLARGDEALAEDLVQSTFLAAIEHRQRFLPDTSVRSWLSGILANKAKESARRGHRTLDPARVPERWSDADTSAHPDCVAQHAELDEALDRAIDSMPSRYRDILTPYLRQGAAAGQIATRLGRPAGSVRTQLVRGLEQLRAKLPAGLTGVFVARLTPGRGIHSVRVVVIESARRSLVATTAASSTAATASALYCTKSVWLALAAVGLFALVWWVLPRNASVFGVEEHGEPHNAATMEHATQRASGSGALPASESFVARRTGSPTYERRLVSGRVVAAEDGRPVPGAEVCAWRGYAYPLRVRGGLDNAFDAEPLARTVADAAGGFTLDCSAGDWNLPLELTAFDGDLQAVVRTKIRAAAEFPVRGAEIKLGPTTVWHGRLLDAKGRPVVGQEIGTRRTVHESERDRTERDGVLRREPEDVVTRTRADGSFAIRWPAGHSTGWEVRHPLHRLWVRTHAPENGPKVIQLEPGRTVSGVVVRADGRPAHGAEVRLGGEGSARAECGADGSFCLPTPELTKYTYLLVDDPESAIHALQPIPADTSSIWVQLDRPRSVRGRVLDDRGHPVANARVTILGPRRVRPPFGFAGQASWVWAHDMEQTVSDEDGRFGFERLYPALFEVRTYLPGDSLRFVSALAHSGDDPITITWTPESLRKVTLSGVVFDGDSQQPIADAELYLWRQTDDMAYATPIQGLQPDGHFEVTGIEPGQIAVGASAPGRAEFLSRFVQRGVGSYSMTIRLHPATEAKVIVRDPNGEPCRGVELTFQGPDGTKLWLEQVNGKVDSLTTDADGVIEARGLPRTRLTVTADRPPRIPQTFALDLRAAGTAPVVLTLDQPLPPLLSFRITVFEHAAGVDPATLPSIVDASTRAQLRELKVQGKLREPTEELTLFLDVAGKHAVGTAPVGSVEDLGANRLCSGRLLPLENPPAKSSDEGAQDRFRASGFYGRYGTGIQSSTSPGPTVLVRSIPARLSVAVERGHVLARRSFDVSGWRGGHRGVIVYLPIADD